MTVSPGPKYGLHAFRHCAASLFIAYLGWTPKKTQVVMGHGWIRMTYDLYGHLFEDPAADQGAIKSRPRSSLPGVALSSTDTAGNGLAGYGSAVFILAGGLRQGCDIAPNI